MDYSELEIVVIGHQFEVAVGNKGDTVRLRVQPHYKKGQYAALVTGHTHPNGEECGNLSIKFTMNSDLLSSVKNAVCEHFNAHHPQHKKTKLKIV